MSDTNWCTFCDCAVSPFSNSVYCSEACRKQDVTVHNFLPTAFVEELRQKQEYGIDTVQLVVDSMRTPPLQPPITRKESSSSISSTDLAAMYFDSFPPTPDDEKPTSLQKPVSSVSAGQNHDYLTLRTPVSCSSYSSTICEKLSPIMLN